MKTILFNTQTNKPISKIYENGYNLLIPEDYVIEIEVVETIMPQIETNQKLVSNYIFQNNKYVKTYNIVEKTKQEIHLESWKHIDYAIRLVINQEILSKGEQIMYMFIKFNARNLPVVESEDNHFEVYCNEIRDEELPLIEEYKEYITIEYRDFPK